MEALTAIKTVSPAYNAFKQSCKSGKKGNGNKDGSYLSGMPDWSPPTALSFSGPETAWIAPLSSQDLLRRLAY